MQRANGTNAACTSPNAETTALAEVPSFGRRYTSFGLRWRQARAARIGYCRNRHCLVLAA